MSGVGRPEKGRNQLILLMRHPETVANREGRFLGRGDSPLTNDGEAQKLELARLARSWCPDAVYSSPLRRAAAVADRIRETAGGAGYCVTLDDLAEIDFGELEGLTWTEASAAGLAPTYTGVGPVAPGGETIAAFGTRVARAASAIEEGPERCLVVTHGGVIRGLLVKWLGLSLDDAWHVAVPHGGVLELSLSDGWGMLEFLGPAGGDVSMLRPAGRPG